MAFYSTMEQTAPAIDNKIKIKPKVLPSSDADGSELVRHGDKLIYEEFEWQCPRSLECFAKLVMSATKNRNLRIDLWRKMPAPQL